MYMYTFNNDSATLNIAPILCKKKKKKIIRASLSNNHPLMAIPTYPRLHPDYTQLPHPPHGHTHPGTYLTEIYIQNSEDDGERELCGVEGEEPL